MSDGISEEAATQMARELAAAGIPSEEIIRRLVERGVNRGIAVSVVFLRTSAADLPQVVANHRDMINSGMNEEGRIIAAFCRTWNRQLAVAIATIGALLLIVFSESDRQAEFLGLTGEIRAQIGFAIFACLLIFSFFNYRCPACNAYLGKSICPSYCQHCGARLG